jgi:type III secretion protein T
MEQGYLNYFLNYPDPFSLFLYFLLGLTRLTSIVALAPFYGAKLLPSSAKMGLAIAVTTIYLPHITQVSDKVITFDAYFLALAMKELIIGFILGFVITIPFQIASTAGVLIDFQRGSSQLTSMDPTLGTQASPLGNILNYMLIVIFFSIGGVDRFMDAIALSYNVVPASSMIPAAIIGNKGDAFWQMFIGLASYLITIATELAAPALVAIFLADLCLGIANRLASQVPMSFLGWSLKSLAGLWLLYLGWNFVLRQLEKQTQSFMKKYYEMIAEHAIVAVSWLFQ